MTQNTINNTENTTLNYKALYDDLIKQHTALKRKTKYGLVWEDKPEDLDNKDVVPLFKHRTDLSLNPTDKPMNYLIQGDNYHSLKVLQHTHRGKIDVIYIDPPYNTGNTDFVYNDKYVDSDDGFRHSKWLSFMDKRLRLARELLSDDGVIFVSIDDNEQAQLKLMMDKIFGERQFVANLFWERTTHVGRQTKNTYVNGENIYVYAKNKYKSNGEIKNLLVDSVQDVFEDAPLYNGSNNVKTLTFAAGTTKFNMKDGTYLKGIRDAYELLDDVIVKNGTNEQDYRVKFKSRWNQGMLDESIANGGYPLVKTDKFAVRFVYGTRDVHLKAVSKMLDSSYGSNQEASRDMYNIFGDGAFDYTKPKRLISYLIKAATWNNKSAIALDFFAGSGTTGHAVMELNKEDGGNRSFILCTNNEVSPEKERAYLHENNLIPKNNKTEYNKYKKEHPEDYKTFTESDAYQELGIAQAVTRERLKRVIEGYTTPKGKVVEGLPNNLTYLQTNEFPKAEVNSLRRKELANLALNSHILKYPESEFETFTVDLYFDIDDVQVTKGKTPTFFVNLRDMKSYAEMQHEITSRFGNHVIIQRFEDYYDLNHDK